jgi:sulfite reductase (ferredoxin)
LPRRHHHPRGLRQLGAQRHGLPAGRRLPRRDVRRLAVRQGRRALPAGPSGHPGLRRKFKIAFSGCKTEACALVSIHDLGGIAATRTLPDGTVQRGFEIYVGGGLGRVPHQAKLFAEFLPEEDLLPLARAIGACFARLGEKKNRQKARLKFLVQKLGIDEFRRLVLEERQTMPEDPSWRPYFDDIPSWNETPGEPVVPLTISRNKPEGYDAWAATNVYAQRQGGYAVATIALPLGDIRQSSSGAGRHRAALRRRSCAHHRRAEHRPALGADGRNSQRCTTS